MGGKKKWAIVKKDTNQIVGRSSSKEKAKASVRIRLQAMGEKAREQDA